MSTAIEYAPVFADSKTQDRPGWIPAEILDDWDPSPYAYQTEEERMPAGGLHGRILADLMERLGGPLAARGLMLLMDIFLLYRDDAGVKQRVAPDLLLMPQGPIPVSYDLDTLPPPLCLIEVTSPDSRVKDLQHHAAFYIDRLHTPCYLAIDAVRANAKPRDPIEIHLWRARGGKAQGIAPPASGDFWLPEMGLFVRAEGPRIEFTDAHTGERLRDMVGMQASLDEQERRANDQAERAYAEAQRADAEAQRADAEAQRADAAEAELARLRSELSRLSGR